MYSPLNNTYGWAIGIILEEIMGFDVSPIEVKRLIKDFYLSIDESDINRASSILKKMREILGNNDSDVVKAQVYLDLEDM